MNSSTSTRVGRRAFLVNGSLVLAAGLDLVPTVLVRADDPPSNGVRFGLVTDLHYADKPPAGTRHYRESLGKLAEAAERFGKEKIAFAVQLGDLIDAADDVETEQAYLKRVGRAFEAVSKERHHVLGNHCVDTLTKDEFLGGVGQAKSYYSFDRGGMHFVVLDACFRSDGKPYGRKNSTWTDANVPADELDWLKEDLKGTSRKVVVFAHQRLDVATDYGVRNSGNGSRSSAFAYTPRRRGSSSSAGSRLGGDGSEGTGGGNRSTSWVSRTAGCGSTGRRDSSCDGRRRRSDYEPS